MEHTTNYQLSLWEQDDFILMDDFNADNAKLDAALKAANDRIDTKADESAVTALQTALAGKADAATAITTDNLPYVIGMYDGDGVYPREFHLGFVPHFIVLRGREGVGTDTSFCIAWGRNTVAGDGIEVNSDGFTLNDRGCYNCNVKNKEYDYIAFK